MSARRLRGSRVGLPKFKVKRASPGDPEAFPFSLSSHARARRAIELGLRTDELGFNIFVLGGGRSGRMSSTRAYLEAYVEQFETPPADWLYLNNFRRSHKPKPYRLPAGQGRHFRQRMGELVEQCAQNIKQALKDFANDGPLREQRSRHQEAMQAETGAIADLARSKGIHLALTPEGPLVTPLDERGKPRPPESLGDDERRAYSQAMLVIQDALVALNQHHVDGQITMREQALAHRRRVVENAISPLLDGLAGEFSAHGAISRWIAELREDVLEHLELFIDNAEPPAGQALVGPMAPLHKSAAHARYAVNLIVDNADDSAIPVVVEPNPTYENLFGSMEYRIENAILTTDFSMIRSGALHRANGGILILRAEALAMNPMAWQFLKGALRDSEIRIEEPQRMGSLPLTGAPQPKPIPLKVKIVVVGDPQYYYAFLALDPEFAFYFKVKADIDATMDADACNIDAFTRLIRQAARRCSDLPCDNSAAQALLGQSARWAGDRTKLAATFELLEDVLAEAATSLSETETVISAEHVKSAIAARRARNSALEDHSHEMIARAAVRINTSGSVTGQINGLTVRSIGDHTFGSPARVTARTYVGRHGIINIDRLTGHGGPIQQKGMFILGGFLHGLFSERCPISFSATVTFEQLYGGVEGDSASLAELCAILSSLGDLPARQDLAITGSVNQVGEAQVIGGLHHKIEGFFRTCKELGLTGTQGVIFPKANETHLVLRDEVAEAVSEETFHLWSVDHIDDAIELFTGVKAGRPAKEGRFPSRSIYGRVQAKLDTYDRILRGRGREDDERPA